MRNFPLLSWRGSMVALLTLLAGPSPAAAGVVGYYRGVIHWRGQPRGKPRGVDRAEVDVFQRRGRYYVDFQVTRDPPGRIVGAVARALMQRSSGLAFTFTDGFGNRGRGRFRPRGRQYELALDVVRKSSTGADVMGLYYHYPLRRLSTHPSIRRHPWSLGRRL
jgi:hypothetical protein